MKVEQLRSFFGHSPALKLLRGGNAPFILAFLHEQFRVQHQTAIHHDRLRAELIGFQSWLEDRYPDSLKRPADEYLTEWCQEESRILRRRFESDSMVYQLTAPSETVLQFIEDCLEREEAHFVGTESRMRRIVETLREISVNASEDPERHIAELERQRDEIEDRIRAIRETGDVRRFHDTQIRERFTDVVEMLRRVLGDFRRVEDAFRDITREVQQREAAETESKGDLLGYALDAEDTLSESDQGISFGGFVEEILVPERQEKLRQLISEVRQVELLAEHEKGMELLRSMMPRLTGEANEVMQTIRRLTASIRRFLDAREAGERRQVNKLIGEIRQLARNCADDPPDEFFIEIEHRPAIASPASREFWSTPPQMESVSLTIEEASETQRNAAFADFAKLRRLDWERMRRAIAALVQREGSVSLPKLLEHHPPRSGAIEVLGYLQIAKDDGHIVVDDLTDAVVLPAGDGTKKRLLKVPKVVFQEAFSIGN